MSQEAWCVPYVGGIIERINDDGTKQFLIQTRYNPSFTSIYNGTFEFAAGALDKAYENVYTALAREIQEETGLTLKAILGDSQTQPISPQGIDKAFGFRPFCCTQQIKDGRPWVGFVFRCEVEPGEPRGQEGESKDVHWMDEADLYRIVTSTPDKFFTLELPAWQYYFEEFPIKSN